MLQEGDLEVLLVIYQVSEEPERFSIVVMHQSFETPAYPQFGLEWGIHFLSK